MSDLADAVNDLAALLEAAGQREGLTARRHSRIIKPARRQIERVLRSYFQRQEAALLAEIKPKIATREASNGGHLYANTILPTSIHPLRFPVTSVETGEYNTA